MIDMFGAASWQSVAQQQAVQLAYSDGLTQSQISTVLRLPLGTVKTRIRDGLHRLAAVLGGR